MFLSLALFGWLNIYGASYTFDQTSIFDFSNRAGKQFVWIMGSLAPTTVSNPVFGTRHQGFDELDLTRSRQPATG